MGHIGAKKLWTHFLPRYEWADASHANNFTRMVLQQCETCQACRPIAKAKLGIEPTLIHPFLMVVDIFKLPLVKQGDSQFGATALCVDRFLV